MKHISSILVVFLVSGIAMTAALPHPVHSKTPQHRQSALAASRSSSMENHPGSPGPSQEADAYVQELCNSIRHEAQYMAQAHGWNAAFDQFTAIKVRTQVVAGTNYFVKVRTAEYTFAHLRIYKPLPFMKQSPVLIDIKAGLNDDEPLEYF